MTTIDQADVIAFLASPATYGGAAVERIDTHAAVVCLAGQRAYKLKRAVRFDYLDFSTPERRRTSCEDEVRLNRRTAPDLYLGVLAITREPDGSLAIDGQGDPVDWVVEMRRFDQALLFDRLAGAGRLEVDAMAPLADAIARFHATAEPRRDHGGAAGMAWVVDGNADGLADFGADMLDPAAVARLIDASRVELARGRDRLEARRLDGFVRHCHGDLHLRNIVLLDGHPTLFDGVEFNDEIACIDVLYDVAFLLMDLWRRDLPHHANRVWNRYLGETDEIDGIALLPLFLSCRAAVRAKTSTTAARFQTDAAQRRATEDLARDYLAMAERLLRPLPPGLLAIGGLSGTGKSTLALALAPTFGPVPGAVVVRSDEIRKRLCGVGPLDRLGHEGYTPEVDARVYATLVERAGRIVRAGNCAIVDAVYARPEDRAAIERVAAEAAVPFVGIWLDAPEPLLVARVDGRVDDASDADAAVVRRQHTRDIGPLGGWSRLEASGSPDQVCASAQGIARARFPDPDAGGAGVAAPPV